MIIRMKRLTCILLMVICPAISHSILLADEQDTPPIGFVVHPHEGHQNEIDKYNITAEISNVFVWRVKDQNTLEVDFDPASKWLKQLYGYNRVAYPIIDTSIFHTSGWRTERTREAGEYMIGADGKEWKLSLPGGAMTWSSLYSPIFRKDVFNYTDQLVNWIMENDPDHKIRGYIDGAEWFMPATVDYNPLGISKFQGWLKEKYSTLDELNQQWGSSFQTWQEVDPPRGTLLGDGGVGMRTVGFGCGEINCDYQSPLFDVSPGQDYLITAELCQKNVPRGLCGIKLDCYDKDNNLIAYRGDGQFYWIDIPDGKKGRISEICTMPPNTVKAKLKLQLMAPGSVSFRNPQVVLYPERKSVLPRTCFDSKEINTAWKLSSSDDHGKGHIEQNNGEIEFCLDVDPLPMPYKHTSLAWDDWITFSYESMGQWLNTCAEHIKSKDPSREVVSYNGCVFGASTLGDFTTYWQRLDISLTNSPKVDVHGVQVCIADKDYTMVTCPLDITRKYGKPIYLTDIVDFPYGLYSGYDAIYRGTLTAVQHGADGLFAYCWLDSGVDAYQFYRHTSSVELKKYVDDLTSAAKLLSGYKICPEIAFVLPMMPYSLADEGGYKSDWLDMGGWCQLLNDMGIITDMYTPYELAKGSWDLSKYKIVVLPDCPVLPQKANSKLVEYVKQGGVVVLSARPPHKDLRNSALPDAFIESFESKEFLADCFATNLADENTPCKDIIRAVGEPVEKSLGKGKVIWLNEKLGKTYWGQARRGRVDGNTPPTYLRPHYTPMAQVLRKNIRKSLNTLFSKHMPERLVDFDRADGSVNIVPFLKSQDSYDDVIFFVINNGSGRHHSMELKLSSELSNTSGEVWIDFDRRSKMTVNADGLLELPDFSDVAIVSLRK